MTRGFGVGLQELVEQLGGELVVPAPDGVALAPVRIDRIGPFDGATPTTITFAVHPRLRSKLADSAAGCVIVSPRMREAAAARGATIVTPDPYLYFARLTQWWATHTRVAPPAGVHPSSVIDSTARLGSGVSVGPLAVVEAGAVLGEGVVVGAQCFVGRDAIVGAGTRFAAQVNFGERCRIGARGIVHGGAVIGADGFGFAPTEGRWEKIEQLGAVSIGDDVEIGANTCIDRGALEDTVIGDGVKLDNQIQIGHNVHIGAHSAIAGCAGIAGSTRIGRHCTIGGAAMISGHLEIVDHVNVSGATTVIHSLREPGTYTSIFPIDDNATWEKNAATLRQLHTLRERIRTLEQLMPSRPLDNKNDSAESKS